MTEIGQAKNILDELRSSGRLEYNEYSSLWDALDGLDANYERVVKELVFILDKLKTERNYVKQFLIRYNVAIDGIENTLRGGVTGNYGAG